MLPALPVSLCDPSSSHGSARQYVVPALPSHSLPRDHKMDIAVPDGFWTSTSGGRRRAASSVRLLPTVCEAFQNQTTHPLLNQQGQQDPGKLATDLSCFSQCFPKPHATAWTIPPSTSSCLPSALTCYLPTKSYRAFKEYHFLHATPLSKNQ